MAFGRLERTSGPAPMSDINMTPLIDVMLVLLVIFIITAPLLTTSALKLDLPGVDAEPPGSAAAVLPVAIDSAGQLYIGDDRVTAEQLEQRARGAAASRDTEVHLRADRRVPYGSVAELIALLQKAGLIRIAFVTDAPAR